MPRHGIRQRLVAELEHASSVVSQGSSSAAHWLEGSERLLKPLLSTLSATGKGLGLWIGPLTSMISDIAGRVSAAPEVKGYHHFVRGMSATDFQAKLLSHWVMHQGQQEIRHQEYHKAVSCNVSFIAKSKKRSKLNEAAQHLLCRLDSKGSSPIFEEACGRLGMSVTAFKQNLLMVVEGHQDAKRLQEIASILNSELSGPSGRPPSIIGVTHEKLLFLCDASDKQRSYTYDSVLGRCVDAATKATELAFGVEKFDPRPICRVMAKRASRSSG